ncbi:MAG: ATP-binding protein [Candidatus Omnitrophica bacterium]|nr:ATP-binding protein [Candidatus Omnitrophota bacterium]
MRSGRGIRKKIVLKEEQGEIFGQKVYLESIMSSMTDALIVINPDATLRLVNKAALDLLGYKEDELIGQPMGKIFLQEGDTLHKYFKKIIIAGVAYNVGLTFLTKQGNGIPVNLSGALIQQEGKIIGIVGVARDMRWIMEVISDLEKKDRELEERSKNLTRTQKAMLYMMGDLDIAKKEAEKVSKGLQKLDRFKDELVSTVSHELRTPMTSIRETISLMLDGILGETTEKQRGMLSMCLEDIDRLGRIINNLLDVSRLEGQKEGIKKESVNLTVLVENIITSFHSLAEAKGLEIRRDISPEITMVYVDKDKIMQVFDNLLGNALKFTKKGYIEISIKDKGKELECAVSDTGIGIAEEHLPEIFNKFVQIERVDGPGEKGTGLGLAISKNIVELHQGKIWAEGALGKGAKFIFTLPKQSPEEVLMEGIEKRVASAKREHREFSVFVVRLDNYTDLLGKIKEEGIKELFSKMLEIRNVFKEERTITLKKNDEMIILADVNKQDVPVASARIKRAVKEIFLETDKENEMSFSYGYATYPDGNGSTKGLLEKAESGFISEREERLKKHIMIVDDDPGMVTMIKKTLQSAGYSNFSDAGDGKEALEKINVAIPDLLILDMKIPLMNGYEVIGRLKENVETKDIPVLIISGCAVEIERLDRYVAKKAIPVLEKPWDVHKFRALVAYLL